MNGLRQVSMHNSSLNIQEEPVVVTQQYKPTLQGLPARLLTHVLSFLHPIEIRPYKRFSAENIEDITDIATLSRHFKGFFTALIKTKELRSLLAQSVSHLNLQGATPERLSCPPFDSPFWQRAGEDLSLLSVIDSAASNLSEAKGERLGKVLGVCIDQWTKNRKKQTSIHQGFTLRIFDADISCITALKPLAGKISALHLPKTSQFEPSAWNTAFRRNDYVEPPHFIQLIGDCELNLHELVICITQIGNAIQHVKHIVGIKGLGLTFPQSYHAFNSYSSLQALFKALPNLEYVTLQFPHHMMSMPDFEELVALLPAKIELRIFEFILTERLEYKFSLDTFDNNLHRFRLLKLLHLSLPVTQSLVAILQRLPQLKTVNLLTQERRRGAFSKQDIEYLCQALPLCRVTIDSALIGEAEERKAKAALKSEEREPQPATFAEYVWKELVITFQNMKSWFARILRMFWIH